MSDIPKYDPTKIVKRAYVKDINSSNLTESSADGEAPKYDASKIVKRGYVAKDDFQEEGFVPEKYVSQGESVEQKIDKIITNNYPDISDDRRKTFKDYAMSGASAEDIKDAILTFQGANPKQMGGNNFYMQEVAPKVYKPVPLRADEKPPAGYDVASVWGDQVGSDDDYMVTSLAKHVWNGVVGAAEGVNSLIETGIGLATGEENKRANYIANKLNKFKFATKSSEKGSLISDKPITEFSDFFDPEQYDFSGNKIQGQILNGIESAISFAAGRGGGGVTTKLANKALSGVSAYNMALTGLLEVADEAGLEGRDKYGFASVAALPQALLESSLGTSGLLTKNIIARQELKQVSLGLAKNLERNAAGELTEGSLRQLQKEMSIATVALNKKFASQLVGNSLEEARTEFLQQFAEQSSKQLYDKLSEDPKFNADAFSLESMGKYVESAIGGLLGSVAPSTAFVSQQRKIARQQLESGNAYAIASKGDEAVEAFNIDIDNKIENGVISQEQGDAAKFKVKAYNEYNKTTENLSLTDENKEKLFKLSFQKENLKAAIKDAEAKDTEGHSRLDKMNPAELGLHNAKVKQAKALQDEIDLIVTKSEVLQQPEVAEKVVEKVVKAEEKASEGTKVKEGVSSEIGAILGRQYKVKAPVGAEVAVPGKAAYEVPKKVLEEKRKMKDFSTEEWKIANATVKQAKFADALEEVPEKTVEGTLQEDNKYYDDKKGLWVQTYNLTLPNGKTVQFASSMVRFPEEGAIGGFRGNTYEENLTNKKSPIGQKLGATVRTLKDSGRKVIFIWNADEGPKYGKHIGMVREDPEGKSVYGAADLDEMADLRMINMGQNPNAPAPGIFTPKEPTKGGPKVAAPVKNKEVRDKLKGLGYSKTEIQAMEPQEANDIVKEKREKSKVKTELKEVEIKEKKAAARANEAKRIAEVNAIIAEDKKKTGGAYITRTAAAKIDEVNARYAALEKPTSAPTDLEAKKADIEKRREKELKEIKSHTGSRTQAKSIQIGDKTFKLGEKIYLSNVNVDMDDSTPSYRTGTYTISMISLNTDLKNGIITLGDGNELITPKISDIINAKYDAELKALEGASAKEKGKVVVKREGIGTENYKNNKNQFTGRSTSKVIPNGEKIKGTYKLVEANDVLASHNEKNFAQTDNFPKREDGSTLNDRDYQKDKNAQNEVVRIANKFDDRAISNIPTVTQDGIVVDGNNRTMSRKLAAENKTDLGYKEALKEKLDMYGFTEKQFNSLKNPFLIFEMEQDVDYTTELFSKFNVAEKKEKSPIDKAVEVSKTIDERSKRLISDLYANVSTPSEVTSNPIKVRQAIKLLQNLGILQPNEIPRYFDITKSTTTRDGVSLLESIVLGSSLTESAIRSLDNEGMGKIKTQLLSSIAQLTKNSSLDENSLKNEISKVVDLINTLKGLDLTLDEYISQPDIFGEKQPISVNDYAIAVAVSQPGFKKWLADYNDRVGQMDMFKGDIVTKKDILEETIQLKTGKTAESIRGIERLQKAKVKPATLNKFEKSVDLFYKTKDADGASKKRSLAAERREFLEKNPTVKYIDDNMKYIYKQLEEQNIIERKGECP